MKSFVEKKISGGKLVGVSLEYGERIEKIKIIGDFFLHPEESLRKIEKALVGLKADIGEKELSDIIRKVLAEENAEFIGLTPEALAEVVASAVKE